MTQQTTRSGQNGIWSSPPFRCLSIQILHSTDHERRPQIGEFCHGRHHPKAPSIREWEWEWAIVLRMGCCWLFCGHRGWIVAGRFVRPFAIYLFHCGEKEYCRSTCTIYSKSWRGKRRDGCQSFHIWIDWKCWSNRMWTQLVCTYSHPLNAAIVHSTRPAQTSLPDKAIGMTLAWMEVGVTKPMEATPLKSGLDK